MTASVSMPETVDVPSLAGALIGLAVFTAAFLIVRRPWRNRIDERIRRVCNRAALQPYPETAIERAGRRQSASNALSVMRESTQRLGLLLGRDSGRAQQRLVQAGYRSPDAVVVYFFLKLVLPLIAFAAAVFAVYVNPLLDMAAELRLFVVLVVALGASVAPDLIVQIRAGRRRGKLHDDLPDCLDLMAICAGAGLSLDNMLPRVAREMRPTAPLLASELELIAAELRASQVRGQTLAGFADRIGLEPTDRLTSTLHQAENHGTSLAVSMRALASDCRNDRFLRANEKRARLPARMTLPLIVFVLPALLLVTLGPTILDIVDTLPGL